MSRIVSVFGKNECARCQSTKRKIAHVLSKKGLEGSVEVLFHDLDTPDGMTEAAFLDVGKIPTTIVNVDGADCGRWDGEIPRTTDILFALGEGN